MNCAGAAAEASEDLRGVGEAETARGDTKDETSIRVNPAVERASTSWTF